MKIPRLSASRLPSTALSILLAICPMLARSAAAPSPEWQWSVPVESVISPETHAHPRAFLWIPPTCKRVRAVVVGQHNIEEKTVFNNPGFRRVMDELGFAIVWVTPPYNVPFNFDQGAGDQFQGMMRALAAESGYDELALAPVVPLGHSATASSVWNFAAWAPDRTLAVVSLSGRWPYFHDKTMADWGKRTVDGVPGLVVIGEREDGYHRSELCLRERNNHPFTPLSMVVEPGGEHFNASETKIALVARFLRKAAQYRLPADTPPGQAPRLKFIDPVKTGWLADRSRFDGKPTAPAAPVDRYTGDKTNAFWFFDEEMAKTAEAFAYPATGSKIQLITYVQNAGPARWRDGLVNAQLKFEPEPDGITFKLKPGFRDDAPFDYCGFKAGEPVTHSSDASKTVITPVDGPVAQVAPDTFVIRFDRVGFDNPKRSGSLGFLAVNPGDATYRPAMLTGLMSINLVNKDGAVQSLTFTTPADVRAGTASLPLNGASSSGLPVNYYVREGPAWIDGSTLRFTAIPPRAKFPIKVTVVAWQWGRSIAPKVQSAQPVERTILIVK